MKAPFHDHPDLVECPHCGEWEVGTRGCWLCDDELIVPVGVAVEFGLLALTIDDAWATEVRALRERHGLKCTTTYPTPLAGAQERR